MSHGNIGPLYPVDHWPTESLRAVATIYREAIGRGIDPIEARDLAAEAYLIHGGEPEGAAQVVGQMLASVSSEHDDWLRGLSRTRIEKQNAALQALGWWPPPRRADKARIWAEEAVRRLEEPPPDDAEVARRVAANRAEDLAWMARKRAEIRQGGAGKHQPLGPSIASCSPDDDTPQRS